LTLREAKAFGDHCRRQYDDHQFDSTYLHRDQLAEAAKAYKLIEDLRGETGRTSYTLLGIVEDFVRRDRLASKSVTLECLIDEYIASRSGATVKYVQDIRCLKSRLPGLCVRVVSLISSGDIESAVRCIHPACEMPPYGI
jgi:hypothetical protein